MALNRRDFLKTSLGAAGLAATAGLAGCATAQTGSAGPKGVVVGAGLRGATFPRSLKRARVSTAPAMPERARPTRPTHARVIFLFFIDSSRELRDKNGNRDGSASLYFGGV